VGEFGNVGNDGFFMKTAYSPPDDGYEYRKAGNEAVLRFGRFGGLRQQHRSRPVFSQSSPDRFDHWSCRRGALKIPPATSPSSAPVNLSQDSPCTHQLLNGGGRREHFANVCAIPMGILVDLLDAGYAQHGQTAGVVGEFLAGQNGLGLGLAGHDQILADSLFIRH
jgi:hypothetical protein